MSNRPRTRRPTRTASRRSLPVVPIVVAVAIAAVAVAAVLITQLGGDGSKETTLRQTGEIEVSGTALPELPESGADPAVGTAAPRVQGTSFDGTRVAIEPGAPTVIVFAAHWCPHCQAEIPKLSGPLRDLPEGTKAVAVSTGVEENRPNYPPSTWFEREKWPTPVLADDADSRAGQAFGLTKYPFLVFLDREGKVFQRVGGGLPADRVLQVLRNLATAS